MFTRYVLEVSAVLSPPFFQGDRLASFFYPLEKVKLCLFITYSILQGQMDVKNNSYHNAS